MNRHIKSIRIKDFQNHEDTHMTFAPGLNVITGSSDSGKSALFRSLMVAYLDDFSKYQVREGKKNTEISIEFVNGDYLKRTKGALNEIEYQYHNQDLVKHTKFAKNIPSDYLDFVGVMPKTSTSALPFAMQAERYFLIHLSDEAIPKEISKLLGIDDLEDAATLLNSENNKISVDIKKLVSEIGTTKTKLEPFQNLDERIEKFNELKNLIEEYENLQSEIDKTKEFNQSYIKAFNRCVACINEKEKNETLELFYNENIPILTKQYNEIKDGLSLIENISTKVDQFKDIDKRYNHFLEIAEGEVGQLIQECDTYHLELINIQNLKTNIETTDFDINSSVENIDRHNKIISDCNENIAELEDYAREHFEKCESCGRFCTCQRLS